MKQNKEKWNKINQIRYPNIFEWCRSFCSLNEVVVARHWQFWCTTRTPTQRQWRGIPRRRLPTPSFQTSKHRISSHISCRWQSGKGKRNWEEWTKRNAKYFRCNEQRSSNLFCSRVCLDRNLGRSEIGQFCPHSILFSGKQDEEQVVRLQITVDDVVWMKELCG